MFKETIPEYFHNLTHNLCVGLGEDKEPIKYGCDDHWTWNRHDRSHEVRLYGTGMRVAHFHPNWSSGTAGVRGTRVLNNGRYYWEMQV